MKLILFLLLTAYGLLLISCGSVPELTKKEKAVNRVLTLDSLTCDERIWLIEAIMKK